MTPEQQKLHDDIHDEALWIVHIADSDTDDLIRQVADYAERLYYRGYEAAVKQERVNRERSDQAKAVVGAAQAPEVKPPAGDSGLGATIHPIRDPRDDGPLCW